MGASYPAKSRKNSKHADPWKIRPRTSLTSRFFPQFFRITFSSFKPNSWGVLPSAAFGTNRGHRCLLPPPRSPLLVQAMSAWLVKTRRAPSRHSRDARVYGHTTTAMHELSTPPPLSPPPLKTPPLAPHGHTTTGWNTIN